MKERLFRAIVHYRKTIIYTFALLGIISIFLARFVGINNDMTDYLPNSSPSTQAIDVMKEEFPPQPSSIRVMIEEADITEAIKVKEALLEINHIDSVDWLDDHEDLEKPIELMDHETVKDYYQDGKALMAISAEVDGNEQRDELIEEIRSVIGKEGKMDGQLDTRLRTGSAY